MRDASHRIGVVVWTATGLIVALAAALVAGLMPTASMTALHEPPLWPFSLRPSLVALDDPDLRREILTASSGMAAAAILLVICSFRRRFVWLLCGVSLVLVAWSAPHLDLLFVDAYPTSYYRSPTGFAAASITRGARLFGPNCASCHGSGGRGDGPLASGLPVPPADLTAPHLWDHSDGDLFWWLSDGMKRPDGSPSMPGFASRLSDEERWSLIDAVRANNAGVAMLESGGWPRPVQAPGVAVTCSDGRTVQLRDLRGNALRLIVSGGPASSDPPQPVKEAGIGIIDIYLSPPAPSQVAGCVAGDLSLVQALAILTGEKPDAMAGEQFLVDPDGWLRARWRPGQPDGWDDTTSLLAAVRAICSHPVATNASVPVDKGP